jgi:ferredoxin-like protein FixX
MDANSLQDKSTNTNSLQDKSTNANSQDRLINAHEIKCTPNILCSPSNKFNYIIYNLLELSQKSILECKHSAVIIKYGVPVAWGYNNISAGVSVHAECSAINRYINYNGFGSFVKSLRKECIL